MRKELLETGTDPRFRKLELRFLIKTAGCLVSLAEIAKFIGSDIEGIFDDLKSLEKAASETDISKIDLDAVNRGIRAARELSDLIRKISYCKAIAVEYKQDFYEVLALYRQEGGLVLTPFRQSYQCGTLIPTEKETCRSPAIVAQVVNAVDLERPGFNLVFATTFTGLKDKSYRLMMVLANLIATSGLDILFKNHPYTGDEISQLFQYANETLGSELNKYLKAFKAQIDDVKGLHLTLESVFVGLAMFILESDGHHRKKIPPIESIFDRVFELLRNLVDSHEVQATANTKGSKLKSFCLFGNADQPDILPCLKIQAMWYSTRKFPYTLLALKDRTDEFKDLPPFSPFVTYMRFHANELIFLGILIRFMIKIKSLKKFWEGRRKPVKPPVSVVFPDLSKTEVAIIEKSFNNIKDIKDDSQHPLKTWVSLGLVDHYTAKKNLPRWFAPGDLDPKFDDFNIRVARALIAKNVFTIIKTHKLIDTLNFVLEFTPIKSLFDDLHIFDPKPNEEKRLFMSRVFIKSHSFERVRLVYEDADKHPIASTKKTEPEKTK